VKNTSAEGPVARVIHTTKYVFTSGKRRPLKIMTLQGTAVGMVSFCNIAMREKKNQRNN